MELKNKPVEVNETDQEEELTGEEKKPSTSGTRRTSWKGC